MKRFFCLLTILFARLPGVRRHGNNLVPLSPRPFATNPIHCRAVPPRSTKLAPDAGLAVIGCWAGGAQAETTRQGAAGVREAVFRNELWGTRLKTVADRGNGGGSW